MKLHTVVICTIRVIFLGNEFCIDIISGYVEFENILSNLPEIENFQKAYKQFLDSFSITYGKRNDKKQRSLMVI